MAEQDTPLRPLTAHVQMLQYRYLDNLDVHIQGMYSGTDYLDASGLHTYASINYLDVSVKGTNGRTDASRCLSSTSVKRHRCICKNRYLADICFLQTSVQGLMFCHPRGRDVGVANHCSYVLIHAEETLA